MAAEQAAQINVYASGAISVRRHRVGDFCHSDGLPAPTLHGLKKAGKVKKHVWRAKVLG